MVDSVENGAGVGNAGSEVSVGRSVKESRKELNCCELSGLLLFMAGWKLSGKEKEETWVESILNHAMMTRYI